jgi:hypothetical protein
MVVNEIEDLTISVEDNIKDASSIKYILMMNFECEKEQCRE